MSTHAPTQAPQREDDAGPDVTAARDASVSKAPIEAFFFASSGGARLFGVWRDAEITKNESADTRHVWVICPPFAEEDKSARRTLTELCQKLQARGEASLLFSLRGTGDSEGDFADSTTEAWRDDVLSACREAARRAPNAPLCLLGVRLGASLAALAALEADASRLVLIEPLLAGRPYLAAMGQRKKLRAMMTAADGNEPKNEQARAETSSAASDAASTIEKNGASQRANEHAVNEDAGAAFEVEDMDGWPIAPPLRDSLNALDLQRQPPQLPPGMSTHVLQVGPRAQIATPLERFARALNASSHAVVMRPFWNLLDYARADALFDAVFQLESSTES